MCSLFSDALGVPQAAYFDFPRWREWGWLSVAAVQFAAFRIRSQNVPLRLTNRRLYIGLHVQDYLAGARRRVEGTLDMMGSKRTGRRYRDPSLSGGGGAFVEKTGAGARERPDDEGGDGAKRRSSRYHREPPERGKQIHHGSGTARNVPDETTSITIGVVPNNEGGGDWSQGVDEADRQDLKASAASVGR